MMQVIEINEGPKIAYEESGTRVYLGDDEIMVNAAKYQRDWPVHLDICSNADKQLVVGTGDGRYYVAQIDIPAIQYEPQPEPINTFGEGQEGGEGGETMGNQEPPKPIPLDMSNVTLTLWSTENPTPIE